MDTVIQVLGVSNADVDIREKLSVIPKRLSDTLTEVLKVCDECVIISTCNRTEIYFNSIDGSKKIAGDIFDRLGWDRDLLKITYHYRGEDAVSYLMEVVCGYHSRILGEEQILGQVKDAYEVSLKIGAVKGELLRLFQMAITCSKEFRSRSGLYRIPVSSASIVVREAKDRGLKRFMLLGFGEIGKLAAKYIMESGYDHLYIAVRNKDAVEVEGDNISVISFKDRKDYYKDVECIISCTSAPHTVISACDFPDNKLLIFDMAVPRDVSPDVAGKENVEVYDIDRISALSDDNLDKRRVLMNEYRFILEEYIEKYNKWQSLKEIAPYIKRIKENAEHIYRQRSITFRNKRKTKDNESLADMLLRSTSDAYVNRAIEVLKEEYLEGRGEQCLRIIEKIFVNQA